jgi:DNA polymerase III subunit epsilon
MLPQDRPLSEVEFVAFDLETTGLFPVVNRIVEFGAVRFRLDGSEVGTWEQLVDPECLIPPGVTDIHGITDAMVRGQPTLAQALPGFLDFLGTPDTILLAHNATFDLGFLNFAAAKTGLALPANPVIDTLDLARTCVRGAPSCRLENLVVHLGLAESEDHRALSDSQLAMAFFTHLAGCIKSLRTVENLFRLSPPMTADDARTFVIDRLAEFSDLATAILEQSQAPIHLTQDEPRFRSRRAGSRWCGHGTRRRCRNGGSLLIGLSGARRWPGRCGVSAEVGCNRT